MRIKMIEESQGLFKNEELDVFSIVNTVSTETSFLTLMVNNHTGLVAVSLPRVEVINPSLIELEFVKHPEIAGGGLVIHNVFSKDVNFYMDIVEYHHDALVEFYKRLKLYQQGKRGGPTCLTS